MTVHNGTEPRLADLVGGVTYARTESLAQALAELQRRLPEVRKSETARVITDKGRYEYRYASLADISAAVLPLLAGLGLSFVCRPTLNAERAFVLAYRLLHVSGEELGGEYPLPASGSPQAAGSAITYARRYTLCAVTGLVASDDDDGAVATAEASPRSGRRGTRTEPGPAASGEQGRAYDPAATRRRAFALFREARLHTREDRLRFCSSLLGRELETSADVQAAEWAVIRTALEQAIAEPHDELPTEPSGEAEADASGGRAAYGG